MLTFILSLTVIALSFLGGFYAGIKNANSSKVAKAKSVIDEITK